MRRISEYQDNLARDLVFAYWGDAADPRLMGYVWCCLCPCHSPLLNVFLFLQSEVSAYLDILMPHLLEMGLSGQVAETAASLQNQGGQRSP